MQADMQDRVEQMQTEMEQKITELHAQHATETRRLKGIIERLQRGSS